MIVFQNTKDDRMNANANATANATASEMMYTNTEIDINGLKYTMDGGADGHNVNSSIDECIHNVIGLGATDVHIHRNKGLWGFNFDVNHPTLDPVKKLTSCVSFFQTKGSVDVSDISKYGKGVKCGAHCLFPKGKMIAGLIHNGNLNLVVYDQGNVRSILPDSSETLRDLYQEIISPDMARNQGFLILANDTEGNYRNIFSEYRALVEDSGGDEDTEIETDADNIGLVNHIAISYSPFLDEDECECHPDGGGYRNISISFNGHKIPSYSHTSWSPSTESEKCDYVKQYLCVVPYRIIDGEKVAEYSCLYFKDGGETFTFNNSGKRILKPRITTQGLKEEHTDKFFVRITKLSEKANSDYNETFKGNEKNRTCSYLIYRNGACSDKSHIPFEGIGGIRPTDCPQLRGEVFVNGSHDHIINPGSNKSIINPDDGLTEKLRYLAKNVHKEVFVDVKDAEEISLEGHKCLKMQNNDVYIGRKKIGKMKGGQVVWDRITTLKKKDKNIILERSHRTPFLRKPIELKDVKDKKGAELRFFTNNPSDLDISTGKIHIISNAEYELILRGDIDPTILDKSSEELREYVRDYWQKKIRERFLDFPEDFEIMVGGANLDISQVTLKML